VRGPVAARLVGQAGPRRGAAGVPGRGALPAGQQLLRALDAACRLPPPRWPAPTWPSTRKKRCSGTSPALKNTSPLTSAFDCADWQTRRCSLGGHSLKKALSSWSLSRMNRRSRALRSAGGWRHRASSSVTSAVRSLLDGDAAPARGLTPMLLLPRGLRHSAARAAHCLCLQSNFSAASQAQGLVFTPPRPPSIARFSAPP